MPITSSFAVSIPAANTQDVLGIDITINHTSPAQGLGGRATLRTQHYKQLPSPDTSGNVNPVPVGISSTLVIGNIFSTDPAPTDATHQAALTGLETAVGTAIQTAVAAGIDPQCATVYTMMTAIQAFVAAKGM